MELSLYQPKNIDPALYSKIEGDIFASFEKDGDPQVATRQMYQFFADQRFEKTVLCRYSASYWKWCIRMYWLYAHRLDADLFVQAFPVMLPGGTSLGFSVIDIYIEYFSSLYHRTSSADVKEVFQTGKRILAESAIPLTCGGESTLTVSDLYRAVADDFSSFDSLKKAEFLSGVERDLFEKNSLVSFVTDQEKTEYIQNLLHLLKFISTTTDIAPVIVSYEHKRDVMPIDMSLVDAVDRAKKTNEILHDLGIPQIPLSLLVRPFDVFEYLDVFVSKDSHGEYEASQVIAELATMAQQRQEPRITDTYYFNEATEKFEWDMKLLQELELIPKQ